MSNQMWNINRDISTMGEDFEKGDVSSAPNSWPNRDILEEDGWISKSASTSEPQTKTTTGQQGEESNPPPADPSSTPGASHQSKKSKRRRGGK